MDEIIKKIIEIDNKGKELKQKKENLLKKNIESFDIEIKSIEDDYYKNGQMLGRMEQERLIEEGESQAERIKKISNSNIEKMNKNFEAIKQKIVEDIFLKITRRQ